MGLKTDNAVADAEAEFVISQIEVPSPDEILEQKDLSFAISGLLARLTQKEKTVIELRFGITESEKTLNDIGALLGLSRSGIDRIEKLALEKLRRWLRKSSFLSYPLDKAALSLRARAVARQREGALVAAERRKMAAEDMRLRQIEEAAHQEHLDRIQSLTDTINNRINKSEDIINLVDVLPINGPSGSIVVRFPKPIGFNLSQHDQIVIPPGKYNVPWNAVRNLDREDMVILEFRQRA